MSCRENTSRAISKLLGEYLNELERKDLEIGIFNASLQDADIRKVRKNWENPLFVNIYNIKRLFLT